jgi:CubicO group peptidase (beta-lactamase class C family)
MLRGMAITDFQAASPQSVGIDPDKLEAVFTRAEKEVREGLLPSCQIAVARDGRLAGFRSFGRVTCEGRARDAGDDTLYVIFSATKGITSAAAWILIQEGKLDVSERVAHIVPEFGTHGKDAIVVEQLFTHTSGFPRAPFRPSEFLDREKRLERFSRWTLNWEPGTRFEYHPSSSMYVVAEIIERRSGMTYGDFVRERIARPLGLPDLVCGLPHEQHARLADCIHVGEALTAEDFARMGVPQPPVTEVTEDAITTFNLPEVRIAGIPGGGGTATAADLALFYQALLHGGAGEGAPIWKRETLEMARVIRSGDLRDRVFGRLANRALGIIIAGDEDRTYRGFGHTSSDLAFGHNGAGGQLAWADPQTGISIGYCTNGHDRNPIRQGRRTVGIGSRAADCLLD